jgi:hypothetical protein
MCIYRFTYLLSLVKDHNYDRFEFRKSFNICWVNEEEHGMCGMQGRVNGELGPESEAKLLFYPCWMRSITGVSIGEETAVLEDKEGRGTWKLYGKFNMLRRFWIWALSMSNEMPPYCRFSRARANSISICYNMQSQEYMKSPEMPTHDLKNFYQELKNSRFCNVWLLDKYKVFSKQNFWFMF